jgi:hypothetical protein
MGVNGAAINPSRCGKDINQKLQDEKIQGALDYPLLSKLLLMRNQY